MKNQEKAKPDLITDEKGLLTTFILAVVAVVLFEFILKSLVNQSTWIHDFFFKRSFVQWVLLTAFAIGFIHLLRRVPAWLSLIVRLNSEAVEFPYMLKWPHCFFVSLLQTMPASERLAT